MGVDLTRKAGVVVSRRHMWWQKLHHDRVAARTANVSLLAQGVYLQLRIKAGQTWNAGSMRLGENEHARLKECQEFVARLLGGSQEYRSKLDQALEILKELKAATLITWGSDKVLYIMDWADEQSQPPSKEAGRKRQERERRRSPDGDRPHGDGDHPDGNDAPGDDAGAVQDERDRFAPARIQERDGDHAPRAPTPPSSPASTTTPSAFGFEEEPNRTDKRSVTKSHIDEDEDEKRDIRPSNSIPTPTGQSPSSAGDEGGVGRASTSLFDDDIYALDPVEAACLLTKESKAWSKNGYSRALRRVGKDLFTTALGELRQAQKDGIHPRNGWGGYFHGIIRKHEERVGDGKVPVRRL